MRAEDDSLMRKTLEMMVAVLLAVFTLASMAEAAPKKAVRHRPRHSSRVSAGIPAASRRKTSLQAKRRPARGPSSASATSPRRKTTKPR
jgi:hypothetical protein